MEKEKQIKKLNRLLLLLADLDKAEDFDEGDWFEDGE